MAVGGFDEAMYRAQDWELNYRLRRSGRRIWFSPELRVTYRPRSTLRELVKQMYGTGIWRREVVRRHPDTLSVRYLAAAGGRARGSPAGPWPGCSGCSPGTGCSGWVGGPGRVPGPGACGRGHRTAGTSTAARLRLPLVLAVTHLPWGLGFLVGMRRTQPEASTRS